ncbi:hypothetical protein ACO1O0_005577 [Amphichorda felina]
MDVITGAYAHSRSATLTTNTKPITSSLASSSLTSSTSSFFSQDLPNGTPLRSAYSTNSLKSSTSISSIGESIPAGLRPRLFTPALRTPTWPEVNGTMSIACSTTIRAPLGLILSLLLDARTYPCWNPFAPGINITHQPKSTAPLPACVASDPVLAAIANNHSTLRDGTAFVMEVCIDHPGSSSSSSSVQSRPRGRPRSMSSQPHSQAQPLPHSSFRRRTTPNLQVSSLEQFEREGDGRVGVRLSWRIKGKVANLLTRSERVQELVPSVAADGTPCIEYVCWETFYGMLAGTMKACYGRQLEAGYAAWMEGLRGYAEHRARVNMR